MIYNITVNLKITVDEKGQKIRVDNQITPSKRAKGMPLWFLAAAMNKTTRDVEKTLHALMGVSAQGTKLSKEDLMASGKITVKDLMDILSGEVFE